MESVQPQTAAMCATHQGAHSTGTCERCGNFVCPLCLDPLSSFPDYCESCREREGGDLITWERSEGSWFSRWMQTTKELLLQPSWTFERSQPGDLLQAVGYSSVTGVLLGAVLGILLACVFSIVFAAMGDMSELSAASSSELPLGMIMGLMVVCAPITYMVLLPVVFIIGSFIRGSVFHVAVLLLGGSGTYQTSLASTFYLHAVDVTMLPITILGQIPLIGPIITMLAYLAIEIYHALALTTVARRYHGLEGGRASAAGWAGFVLVVVLAIGACLLGALLVLAGR